MTQWNTLPPKAASSRTTPRQFRITHTQDALITQRLGNRSSALIRVLLQLYFNRKLDALKFQGIDVEKLLDKEMIEAQEAILQGAKKGTAILKRTALAKRNGTF